MNPDSNMPPIRLDPPEVRDQLDAAKYWCRYRDAYQHGIVNRLTLEFFASARRAAGQAGL